MSNQDVMSYVDLKSSGEPQFILVLLNFEITFDEKSKCRWQNMLVNVITFQERYSRKTDILYLKPKRVY